MRELDHEPDNYEHTYLNRDASAVLFNSLAAVHITAAERMKQVMILYVVLYSYKKSQCC